MQSNPSSQVASAPYGLLGRTLGHSWSPQIHAALGSAPYDLREVEPAGLRAAVREDATWRGLNVTIPYKRDVIALADEVTPLVGRVGAANTLVRRPDGTILADNTDVTGFSWMLQRFCTRELEGDASQVLTGRQVLVLGSGGASRAVTCALEGVGACVSVISRKGPDTYADLAQRHRDALLVVNATPVGMYPACPASALPEATLAALPQLEGVLDVVYNPHRTGICLAAGHLGIPYESGLAMLVAQARFSSELFQGTALPDDAVTSIERDIMRQTTSVFLIGMPGSGKTGAGRRLARLLSRPFVDLDDAAVLEAGCDIPSYFERHGEAAFRDLETKVLATYAGQSGLVIACGGGVVERPENLDLLRQNGLVVMLDRALDELACDGRPVTAARGVDSIAASRMPLYRSWSDLVIRCTGSAEGDAEKIVRLLGAWPDDGPAHSICT